MNNQKIDRLVDSHGKTRVVEMNDGSVVQRDGGSASWRNNNPGNLKFEFSGSADKTVHVRRTKERALEDAQARFQGVVGLDQWGNAVFETYEAGRTAKLQLLERMHGNKNVEAMLESYSTSDYTGVTHHQAQADFIYREGDRQGFNLRAKTIAQMSNPEREALADGIKGFEGWQPGTTRAVSSHTQGATASAINDTVSAGSEKKASNVEKPHHDSTHSEGLQSEDMRSLQQRLNHLGYRDPHGNPLTIDGTPGPNTTHAIKSFQHTHRLHVDGVAGKDTLAALVDARHSPLLSEATHPAHPLYTQMLHGIGKLPHGTFESEDEQRHLAVALTIAAHVSGFKKVDHVVLGTNGVNVFAVQGRLDDPAHLRTHVDRMQSMTHVVDHNSLALQDVVRMHAHPVHAHTQAPPYVGQRATGMEINR